MHIDERMRGRATALMLLTGLACGSESVTAPPDPPEVPTPASPASIRITSPIGGTLDLDGTAQLVGEPLDAAGEPVNGVQLTWATSDPDVASVSANGLVTARAIGVVEISASVGSVTTEHSFRVVDADLGMVTALASDAFAEALGEALSPTRQTAVAGALDECEGGAAEGNVEAVAACVETLHAEAVAATDPSNRALLAVVTLYADEMLRRLNL